MQLLEAVPQHAALDQRCRLCEAEEVQRGKLEVHP